MSRYFHSTTEGAAASIIREGFRDSEGTYVTDRIWKGVWLSDRPLDGNEGTKGDVCLVVEFAEAPNTSEYEWVEEGKLYREWLVPADVINGAATISRYVEVTRLSPCRPNQGGKR